MNPSAPGPYASRAGDKLAHALRAFSISPVDWTCADLGSNVGGFVDCLLRAGARRVFAIERGYGVLAWSVRSDSRVVVMERTDARKVRLPEPVQFVTIDTGWTRQSEILPSARDMLAPGGHIVTLVKPHYEADAALLAGGVLPDDRVDAVLNAVESVLPAAGLALIARTESPIRGHAGNREFLWHLVAHPAIGQDVAKHLPNC
jgi:23S rRNA (cytidine1920-2'-O)/16S rRNA (cytidine1409-2'-O)-methyltransferase